MPLIKSKKNFLLSLLIFVTATNLFLISLPLTNIIGYEFSAVNAILLFVVGFILTNRFTGSSFLNQKISFLFFRENLTTYLTFVLLPVVISTLNTIVFHKCPVENGILYYLMITVPAYLYGISSAIVISTLVKKRKYLFFLVFFFLLCLEPLLEIYFYPQIYFYNPIVLFFNGTIYDEDIIVNSEFLIYRLITSLIFILPLIALYFIALSNKKRKIIFTASLIILCVLYFFCKSTMGFNTDYKRLKKELGGNVSTEHFEIIYSKDIKESELKNLILSHEYYFEEIKDTALITPSKKITSFVFKDKIQKRKLFGAGNADVAKPWLYQIYVDIRSYQTTLKHELVHVFSAEIGKGFLKLPSWINPAMIEGYAMAVENNYGENDIHYMAFIAKESGYNFPVKELFTGMNFLTKAPSISYIFSGSFIKYLADEYGIEKVNKVYSDLNFEKHFQIPIDSLEKEYYSFLNNLEVKLNENTAKLFFGRKTIFKKHCVRYTAKKIKEAWRLYNNKSHGDALIIFKDIYELSESYSALIGIINCYKELENYETAHEFLSGEIGKFETSSYIFNLELMLADLDVINKHYGQAEILYTELLEEKPSKDYYNITSARMTLLKSNESKLHDYLLSEDKGRYEILKSLYFQDYNAELLPLLMRLSVLNNENYEEFIDRVIKFSSNDQIDSYTAYELSQYFLDQNDYELAEEYAELAFGKDHGFEKAYIYKENLNKIEWFIKK
ncbi:MAG: hypothetical protein PVH88_01755 [Ignavibacteria bacterium]|jgi:hypothetical protein